MGNLALLQALVFEPRKAFAELAARPVFWFPLLLLVLASAGVTAWYQFVVDGAWLADLQIRSSAFARNLTEAQIAAQVEAGGRNTGLRATVAGIANLVIIPLVMLITAGYYLLAAKITNVPRGFRQWFAFTGWTSLPSLLQLVPAVITLLTASTAQIDPGEMQPLSINALFVHRQMGEDGYALFSALNLTMVLSSALGIVGVQQWSGRSWVFSSVFVLLPLVLIFGIWAAISLGGS